MLILACAAHAMHVYAHVAVHVSLASAVDHAQGHRGDLLALHHDMTSGNQQITLCKHTLQKTDVYSYFTN